MTRDTAWQWEWVTRCECSAGARVRGPYDGDPQVPAKTHRLPTPTISGLVNAVVKRSLVELGQRRRRRRHDDDSSDGFGD